MQSRVIYLIVTLSFFLFVGCSTKDTNLANMPKDHKAYELEDEYILYAIEHTNQGNYLQSRDLYYKLFENTNKYEYLLKSLRYSLQIKDFKSAKEISYKNLNENIPEYEEIYRIYIVSLINLKEYDEGLKYTLILLDKFNNITNKELIANIYYMKEDFVNATKYFEEIYSQNLSPTILVNLVDILYSFIDEKQNAITYLETHVRLKGCEDFVCTKLLSIYEEENNIDGIISVLKKMYEKFKKDDDFSSTIKVYNILIAYLEQKNINEAIRFLEENHIDDTKLVSLYKRANRIQDALILTKKLYELNNNIDLLAQIAILEFEHAKNKKMVLKDVVSKLEDVLHILDNDVYQNYLGYILIDYDIDVNKGVELVKKALKKVPNNYAYIDSLAWGLYKQKKCKEAYKYMKIVVDAIGLNDSEIILHWNLIKQCFEK